MASFNDEQRAGSGKDDTRARPATQQATERAPLAENPLVSPFGLLSALMGDMDRMLRRFALPAPFLFRAGFGAVSPPQVGSNDRGSVRPTWAPPLEVLTRDGEFVVRAEIPGIDKEHVHVEISEGRAVISGEREEEHEDEGEGFYRSERSYGAFSREVPLPEGADAEQAKAMAADGLLEIVIPMASAQPKAHRLEIQEASAPEPDDGAQDEPEEQAEAPTRQRTSREHQRKGKRKGTR